MDQYCLSGITYGTIKQLRLRSFRNVKRKNIIKTKLVFLLYESSVCASQQAIIARRPRRTGRIGENKRYFNCCCSSNPTAIHRDVLNHKKPVKPLYKHFCHTSTYIEKICATRSSVKFKSMVIKGNFSRHGVFKAENISLFFLINVVSNEDYIN